MIILEIKLNNNKIWNNLDNYWMWLESIQIDMTIIMYEIFYSYLVIASNQIWIKRRIMI